MVVMGNLTCKPIFVYSNMVKALLLTINNLNNIFDASSNTNSPNKVIYSSKQ